MRNLLREGVEWKDRITRSSLSAPVVYLRGDTSYHVCASYGQTSYEVENSEGVTVGALVFDFLIAASELDLTPQRGDRILAEGVTYQVAEYGPEGCWRWSDPFHVVRRIHTKGA